MFRPLSVNLAWRYIRAKRRNQFISFISWVSLLGIALGICVLITVLSVMNGFDHTIRNRILNMVPQVTVTQWGDGLSDWSQLRQTLITHKKDYPNIVSAAPFVQGQAMLSAQGAPSFSVLMGVDPKLNNTVSPIGNKLIAGTLSSLKPGKFNIILGEDLANRLGVTLGDKVTVIVPKINVSLAGIMPRLRVFTVSGIFHVGYQFDSTYALINMRDAQALLSLGSKVTGLQLKLRDLFLAPMVVKNLNQHLPSQYRSYDWTMQNANFFKALKLEKTMMFLILFLIVAVAAFNMLSSLVMTVTDKQSVIAILRTMGASSGLIIRIFLCQGVLIGLIGTVLGVVGGVLLSLHVTELSNWLQHVLGTQFLNANVYYINYLPSQLEWSDVGHVALISMVLSFLATLYPAWRASRIAPAEALRYE